MTGQLAGPVRLRWPLAMTAIMVGVLVSLGFWQLDRLSWKQQLIDRIEESLAKPARPLPAEDPSLSVLEYRRVVFKGRRRQRTGQAVICGGWRPARIVAPGRGCA